MGARYRRKSAVHGVTVVASSKLTQPASNLDGARCRKPPSDPSGARQPTRTRPADGCRDTLIRLSQEAKGGLPTQRIFTDNTRIRTLPC